MCVCMYVCMLSTKQEDEQEAAAEESAKATLE